MTDKHQPDPEFVSRLEWQLKSELRRQQRTESDSPRPRLAIHGWLRIAALVLLSVSLGAAGVVAASQFENSRLRQLWMARAMTSVEVAQARVEALETMISEVEKERRAGIIGEETYLLSHNELEKARRSLRHAQLELEEIEASGRPPRSELFAPAVGGRDYVGQRLQLEREGHLRQLQLIEPFIESVRERHRLGLIGDEELFVNEQEWERLGQQLDDVQRRLQLRNRFLDGELTPFEIDLQERLRAAQGNLQHARTSLETATFHLEKAEERFRHGLSSEMEITQARFEFTRARAEERLAQIELELLESQRR